MLAKQKKIEPSAINPKHVWPVERGIVAHHRFRVKTQGKAKSGFILQQDYLSSLAANSAVPFFKPSKDWLIKWAEYWDNAKFPSHPNLSKSMTEIEHAKHYFYKDVFWHPILSAFKGSSDWGSYAHIIQKTVSHYTRLGLHWLSPFVDMDWVTKQVNSDLQATFSDSDGDPLFSLINPEFVFTYFIGESGCTVNTGTVFPCDGYNTTFMGKKLCSGDSSNHGTPVGSISGGLNYIGFGYRFGISSTKVHLPHHHIVFHTQGQILDFCEEFKNIYGVNELTRLDVYKEQIIDNVEFAHPLRLVTGGAEGQCERVNLAAKLTKGISLRAPLRPALTPDKYYKQFWTGQILDCSRATGEKLLKDCGIEYSSERTSKVDQTALNQIAGASKKI